MTTQPSQETSADLFAVGDVHGDLDRLLQLLHEAAIVDNQERWQAENATVIFIGDLTDRGPKGVEVVRFVQELQTQLREAGGEVECLMGNHDAMILSRAFEFRGEPADPRCKEVFLRNGGNDDEARQIANDPVLFDWLQRRPLLKRVGDNLFQHADGSLSYLSLGNTVDEVNEAGRSLAQTGVGIWRIFNEMTPDRSWRGPDGRQPEDVLRDHLNIFGARRVVHGHTEHCHSEPQVYHGGMAINIDGSMSSGMQQKADRGFIWKVPR